MIGKGECLCDAGHDFPTWKSAMQPPPHKRIRVYTSPIAVAWKIRKINARSGANF